MPPQFEFLNLNFRVNFFLIKGPDLVPRGAVLGQHPVSLAHQITVNHANSGQNHSNVTYPRHPVKLLAPGLCHSSEQTQSRRSSPENRSSIPLGKDSRANNELQGVVLTLASPGSDHHGRL